MSTDNESKTPARTHERPHFMTQAWLAEQAKTSLLALEVVHLDAEIAKLREENKQQAENLASSKENGDAEGVSEGVSAGGCKAAGAEVCGRCGATSAKDAEAKCRPEGDSCPGVGLWWRQAAGAAAPVGPSITALIQGAEDAASDWCRCVCDYREACRVAPPPSPRDVSDAVRESGRKCELAWDVLRKAIRAIAADLHQSTPAADARQPDNDPHMFSSDGRHHPDKDSMVVGFIVPQQVADELAAMEARLAASEKARADLLHALVCRNDPLQGASYRDLADRVIAAERAGGAS